MDKLTAGLIGITCIGLVLILLRKKKTVLVGTVVKKEMSLLNMASSYITIETSEQEQIELCFETTENLSCHHPKHCQCFHGSGEQLDRIISEGATLEVEVENNLMGEIRYVRRIFAVAGRRWSSCITS